MVAVSGPGWRLAPALITLVHEADRLWPHRDRASDGSIGDARHASTTSDHNPRNGYVWAVDITEDLTNGPDLQAFWDHLVAARDGRVKYLIYEGRILSSYPVKGIPAWTPRPYDGLNAHRHHLHVSVLDAARDSADPWFAQEDDDMDEATLRRVLNEGTGPGQLSWAGTSKETLAAIQATFNLNNANTAKLLAAIGALDDEIADKLAESLGDGIAERIVARLPVDTIDTDELRAIVREEIRAPFADAGTPDT